MLLINPWTADECPPPAIGYLQAVLKKYNVDVIARNLPEAMLLNDNFDIIGVSFHSFSVKYARQIRDKFRGKLVFYPEKCIGCKLCMRDCPSGAINIVKRPDNTFEAQIDLGKCIYCAQCVDSCPKKALEATKDVEHAQLDNKKLKVVFNAETQKRT